MEPTQKQIVVVKPKSLSPKDKEKLTKAGNIVIEHANVAEILFRPQVEIGEYEFINCATCGDRIYLLKERLTAIRKSHSVFYCSRGHQQSFL